MIIWLSGNWWLFPEIFFATIFVGKINVSNITAKLLRREKNLKQNNWHKVIIRSVKNKKNIYKTIKSLIASTNV